MKKSIRIIPAVIAGFMTVLAFPVMAGAETSTQVVLPDDVARQAEDTPPTKQWVSYYRTEASTANFRNGPESPPLNAGSLELSTPNGGDKITTFNFDHVGDKLSDIKDMAYSTYRSKGNLQQVAALNLQVDYNGPDVAGGFTTLIFEPVYNTDQDAVTSGEWQSWDAYNGGNAHWWSSNPIGGAPNKNTFPTWSTLVAENPDATILGGVGINQGSGNPELTTAVDEFTYGTTDKSVTYDFELTAPKPVRATNKDQCKDGNYKNFQTNYKNQGDCVSDVASGGKAKGNPTKSESPFDAVMKFFGL